MRTARFQRTEFLKQRKPGPEDRLLTIWYIFSNPNFYRSQLDKAGLGHSPEDVAKTKGTELCMETLSRAHRADTSAEMADFSADSF